MDASGNPAPSFLVSVLELPPGYLSKGIYQKGIHSFKIIRRAPEGNISDFLVKEKTDITECLLKKHFLKFSNELLFGGGKKKSN